MCPARRKGVSGSRGESPRAGTSSQPAPPLEGPGPQDGREERPACGCPGGYRIQRNQSPPLDGKEWMRAAIMTVSARKRYPPDSNFPFWGLRIQCPALRKKGNAEGLASMNRSLRISWPGLLIPLPRGADPIQSPPEKQALRTRDSAARKNPLGSSPRRETSCPYIPPNPPIPGIGFPIPGMVHMMIASTSPRKSGTCPGRKAKRAKTPVAMSPERAAER